MEAWKDYKVKKIRVLGMGFLSDFENKGKKAWKYIRCDHMVQLNVMDEDEAWNLFNMNENLNGASPEIIEVAMEVAKECGGLPLAIIPLARALRGKIING
ncbi:hypothetical protein GOBAR_DD00755 [Gossypium barbadense]|nr:hypothetical protein GOBAR_DD00755 [Gossypium barbadense]